MMKPEDLLFRIYRSISPFRGVCGGRVFTTNGELLLMDLYSTGSKDHERAETVRQMLSGKERGSEIVEFKIDPKVPSGEKLCTSCWGTTKHLDCCVAGITPCFIDRCIACDGRGIAFPVHVFDTPIPGGGGFVDAFYARLCLRFLRTKKPLLAKRESPLDPLILSNAGRDAILMPLKVEEESEE